MKNSFLSHNLFATPLPKFSCCSCSSSSYAAAAASSSSSSSSQCQKCKRDIYCVQKKLETVFKILYTRIQTQNDDNNGRGYNSTTVCYNSTILAFSYRSTREQLLLLEAKKTTATANEETAYKLKRKDGERTRETPIFFFLFSPSLSLSLSRSVSASARAAPAAATLKNALQAYLRRIGRGQERGPDRTGPDGKQVV
jgi:hypothetical protein